MDELHNKSKNSLEENTSKEINILLVEDNLGDVRLIQEMIEGVKSSFFNLLFASDLTTGLEIISKNRINVILLDLSLPDSHGIETVKNVLKNEACAPIIVLTGTDDQSLALDAVKLGAEDYLVKGQVNAILLERSINYAIERFQIKKQLENSEKKYRAAYNRATFYKDLFTHDMNNILQNILATTELGLEHLNPEKFNLAKEVLEISKDQIYRGALLIKNVRKLSQLEELKAHSFPVELQRLLKESINHIRKKFAYKKVNINLDSQIEELSINANELLKDIFDNLLINAIRHNEHDIIEIIIKISRESENNINYIKIEFIDNGIGIEDKWKDTIFMRNIEDVKSLTGMGLGLTLVKKILESYNGRIYIQNRVKDDYAKGSNFIVEIPEVIQV